MCGGNDCRCCRGPEGKIGPTGPTGPSSDCCREFDTLNLFVGTDAGSNAGNYNTGVGREAMGSGTNTGDQNTALGVQALYNNTSGDQNTALGFQALYNNTFGVYNNANGYRSLYNNTSGVFNVSNGVESLYNNVSGDRNVGIGDSTLFNVTGDDNVGLGSGAGSRLTSGNNNMCLHNSGSPGDSNTIRIGNVNQNRNFISGVNGVTVSNQAVVVIDTTSNQLGVNLLSGPYTPGDSSKWSGDPTSIKEALDRMANLLYALNGNNPIP